VKFFQPFVPRDVQCRISLDRGDQVLAVAQTTTGSWLIGTRGKLIIVGEQVVDIPWHEVEDATWESESATLVLRRLAPFGEPVAAWTFGLTSAERLVQLLHERVMSTIISRRRVEVGPGNGFTVIGRRDPLGSEIAWMTSYDVGLDPTDPEIEELVASALAVSRREVGS